jgi:HK97 family phage major capsid protein
VSAPAKKSTKTKKAPTGDSKQVRSLIEELTPLVAELEVRRAEEDPDVEEMEKLATRCEELQGKIDRLRKIAEREKNIRAVMLRSAPAADDSSDDSDDSDESDDDSDDEPTGTRSQPASGKGKPRERLVYAEARHGFIPGFGIGPEASKRAYEAGMWYRGHIYNDPDARQWCANAGLITQRAQQIGDPALGGNLVPLPLLASIISLLNEYGQFAPNVTRQPMTADTLEVPRRVGGLKHYFVGEGAPTIESDATWDRVKLSAKKMVVANRLSTEVMEDSIIELGSYLTLEFGRAYALGVDMCGFNGDGVSPEYGGMTGIIPALEAVVGTPGIVQGVGTGFETLTIADFIQCIARLPAYALPGARWFISPSGFAAAMQRLSITSGSFTGLSGGNSQSDIQNQIGLRFLGYPVVLCHALDTELGDDPGKVKVLFGDLAMGVLFGDRRKVSIKTSYERLVELDQVLMTSTMRFDINVHGAGKAADLAVPGSKAQAGPIVGLKTK